MTFEDVSTSFRKVVIERQYYRVITATFTHLNILHIVFNMASLYSIGMVEAARGSLFYAEQTVLLIFASQVAWMGLVYLAARWLPEGAGVGMIDSSAVGYSGVLFGWMTLLSVLMPGGAISIMGFGIPMAFAPWASLFLTQLIMPQASFTGHLSGIVAGYAIGFGLFSWVTGYWLWTTAALLCLVMLLSLRANASTARLLGCLTVSPAFVAHTGLGASVADLAAAAGAAPAARRYMDGGVLRVERGLREGDIEVTGRAEVTTGAAPAAAAAATAAGVAGAGGGGPAPAAGAAAASAGATAPRLLAAPAAAAAGASGAAAAATAGAEAAGAGGRGGLSSLWSRMTGRGTVTPSSSNSGGAATRSSGGGSRYQRVAADDGGDRETEGLAMTSVPPSGPASGAGAVPAAPGP